MQGARQQFNREHRGPRRQRLPCEQASAAAARARAASTDNTRNGAAERGRASSARACCSCCSPRTMGSLAMSPPPSASRPLEETVRMSPASSMCEYCWKSSVRVCDARGRVCHEGPIMSSARQSGATGLNRDHGATCHNTARLLAAVRSHLVLLERSCRSRSKSDDQCNRCQSIKMAKQDHPQIVWPQINRSSDRVRSNAFNCAQVVFFKTEADPFRELRRGFSKGFSETPVSAN